MVQGLAPAGEEAPHRDGRWIIRRYYGPGQWWPTSEGVRLSQPATVKIGRYRFRGTKIPNPWQIHAQNTASTALAEPGAVKVPPGFARNDGDAMATDPRPFRAAATEDAALARFQEINDHRAAEGP